ncbi:MAG: bifunctional acetate--CoA ligase family protein/GNAT family N-acetyltransferase [Roseibium sp.]|nr:bifunctional acetate--CoA ligase family protein/GNAT family N-acetyltransferase [Roseibium sp.]
MTIRNLDGFFAPRSIAVIGPSRHPAAFDRQLLEHLEAGLDQRPVHLVGVKTDGALKGHAVRSLDALPAAPDLAIYLGPNAEAPATVARLADSGTRAVLFLSPGFEAWPEDLKQSCREAAQEARLRLIGPGSLGLAAPGAGLNSLVSTVAPAAGNTAFIARSGAVVNGTLSWAKNHKTGFSAVVSLGARLDVDIGDLVDYFAQDFRTRSILLHIDAIYEPRKFLSAARAAARSKPVVVIRSGRSSDVITTGRSHAGRLANADRVYETAFRRTGLMRVSDLDEMFEAVETLSRIRVPQCKTIAVVSNGRSLASLAADRIADLGGDLAALSTDTRNAIATHCRSKPDGARQHDLSAPIVLREDLPDDALHDVLSAVLSDRAVDGVLAIHAGTAATSLKSIGETIAAVAKADRRRTGRRKAVVAGLVGCGPGDRQALDEARVPCATSPAEAVRSIMHVADDAGARDFLMAAPPSLPEEFTPDTAAARVIIDEAIAAGKTWLPPKAVNAVLAAYHIPVIETRLAQSGEEAGRLAQPFFATARHCVAKLVSPDLPFKSHINGVRLGLESPEAVAGAADELLSQTRDRFPDAEIAGISVHPMLEDRDGLELYMGLADTPTFGPVLVFGHGGTGVEDSQDHALELPPLDLNLAQAMINRTRIVRLLDGGKARPRLDRDAVALTLVKLSQITIDIPEILELDINPIVARREGLLALDARMTLGRPITHPGRSGRSRLAIAPYPKEWEQALSLKNGDRVFVRPVKPEDEELFRAFFQAVSPADLRLRFFAPVQDFNHRFLARLTQLDYARAMAFAALDPGSGNLVGVVRLHADPDHLTGEYAVMVRSDLKGQGLGWALMKLIIRYAKADGIQTIKGEVLKENTSMLGMCKALGFSVQTSPDDPGIADVVLPVTDLAPDG